MDLGTYMEGLAARIDLVKAAIGVEGVSYPPINYVPKSPWLMIRQSLVTQTMVSKGLAGMQVVNPSIDLVGLVKADPMMPGEAARLDRVMHPLLDLFDANANGGNVNNAFRGLLTEHIDQVWNEAMVRRGVIPWGESGDCHALIITLDSEFKRRAELP